MIFFKVKYDGVYFNGQMTMTWFNWEENRFAKFIFFQILIKKYFSGMIKLQNKSNNKYFRFLITL